MAEMRAAAADTSMLALEDGAKVAYRVVGPPIPSGGDSVCTVLCFNPGGCSLVAWAHAAAQLAAAGVRCVLHDCRGLGGSCRCGMVCHFPRPVLVYMEHPSTNRKWQGGDCAAPG
jgi:pimeloyl-ACP methyl ester carboxylesterase